MPEVSNPSIPLARYVDVRPEGVAGGVAVFGCEDSASGVCVTASNASALAFVGDERVAAIHGDFVSRVRNATPRPVFHFSFPEGEAGKTLATVGHICSRMAAAGMDRNCVVVGFGGGVSTDVAAMVASLWMRGVRLIHVPTTLLAMADAAIGGKGAVNLPEGRNLAGAWRFPEYVFADRAFLKTLPVQETAGGLVEIVKTAAVGGADLFSRLEAALDFENTHVLFDLAHDAASIKAAIVRMDPFDTGIRQTLNFGHTVGHAIEAASCMAVSHGDAVAAGMAVESAVGVRLGIISERDRERLISILRRIGAPTEPQVSFELASEFVARDKKNIDSVIRMAIPEGFGKAVGTGAFRTTSVPGTLLMECWHAS